MLCRLPLPEMLHPIMNEPRYILHDTSGFMIIYKKYIVLKFRRPIPAGVAGAGLLAMRISNSHADTCVCSYAYAMCLVETAKDEPRAGLVAFLFKPTAAVRGIFSRDTTSEPKPQQPPSKLPYLKIPHPF
jgi:hypothetical protein